MAKVTYNKTIHSLHGAVGRLVFYERNGRMLLRSKGERTKPRSEAQILSQEAFREAAACWKGLSAERKEPWRAFGKEQRITGYNAFLRVNIPRLKRRESVEMDAPVREIPSPWHGARNIHAGEGCRRFMEEMRRMVRRVSCETRFATAGCAAVRGLQ